MDDVSFFTSEAMSQLPILMLAIVRFHKPTNAFH